VGTDGTFNLGFDRIQIERRALLHQGKLNGGFGKIRQVMLWTTGGIRRHKLLFFEDEQNTNKRINDITRL
jgi:hypothetical protein